MSVLSRGALAALALVCLLSAGCAGSAKYASKAMPASAIGQPMPAPQPLEKSHFSRDPDGQLTEEKIQLILRSPIELELPSRVGVLPVLTAKDWRGPSPDYDSVPAGVTELVKGLQSSESFSLVTEMMPIPSGALGMEALREIAARYQLRYIILYREVVRKRVRANAWAAGYATLVGALFLPGQDLRVDGYLEASLFDVQTGLLLFTTRRAIRAEKMSNVWYKDDKLEAMQAKLARKFAPDLAKDVKRDTGRFAEAARIEWDRKAAKAQQGQPPEPPAEALLFKRSDA